MRTRISIVFALSFAAVAIILGVIALRNDPTIETRVEWLDAKAHPTEEVGKVIAFVRRPERLLASGEFRVRERDGRFTVEANEAWRFEILEELAKHGEFELIDHLRRHPYVTLSLRNEPIEAILGMLVRDTPYLIRYFASEQHLAAGIDSLEIGQEENAISRDASDFASENSPSKGVKARDLAKRADRERASVAPRPEGERRMAMERREARERRRGEQNRADLEHADASTRAWAASTLDVEDPQDLDVLSKLLGNDPDPEVRAEIAYDLGFADPRLAVPALVSALDDPSTDVVVAAVDALGFLDDAAVVADLNELLSSESPKVHAAARGALDLLDDQ